MTKRQFKEVLNVTQQILPFLTITATFISLAYTYGSAFSSFYVDNCGELIRLSCNYLP